MILFPLYLWSLIGPFILILVLKLLPLGIFLEEAFKGWLTYQLIKTDKRASVWAAVGIGAAYGFSELVLFSLKYWPAGQYDASLARLLLTVPLHGLTTALWYAGLKRKKVWLGALAALAVHFLFNRLAT